MHFSFLEKFGASILIVMWVVWGSNTIGNFALPEPAKANAIKIAGIPEIKDSNIVVKKSKPKSALLILAKSDPKKGAKVFNKCKACHTPNRGGKNRVGPNLWDIVGKKIAANSNYSYSNALKNKDGDWSFKNLNAFLKSPRKFAKGTKMTFSGISNETQRAALLVYLRDLSDNPKPLP